MATAAKRFVEGWGGLTAILAAVSAFLFGVAGTRENTNSFEILAAVFAGAALIVVFAAVTKKTRETRNKFSEFAKTSDYSLNEAFRRAGDLAKTVNASQAYQLSLAFCDLLTSRALAITSRADRCAIWIPSKEGSGLDLYFSKARKSFLSGSFSRRLTPTSTAAEALAKGIPMRVAKGEAALSLQTPKPGYSYIAYICVPILDGSERVAVITMDTERSPQFGKDDEIRLDKLAKSAARPLRQLLSAAKVHVDIDETVKLSAM